MLLIGDAAHATTPQLAMGGAIALEDGIVLGELLAAEDELDVALESFIERRYERCRMVVENSARIGQLELTGGDKEEHSRLMRQSLMALAQPI